MLVTYNIFNSVDLLNADYWRLFLKLWLTRTKGKLETFLVWIAWIKWEWRCSFCLYLVLLLANLCLRDCCKCLCSRAENLDYYHVWSPEYKSWFFASQLQTSRPFRPHIPRIRFLRSSARAVASWRQVRAPFQELYFSPEVFLGSLTFLSGFFSSLYNRVSFILWAVSKSCIKQKQNIGLLSNGTFIWTLRAGSGSHEEGMCLY